MIKRVVNWLVFTATVVYGLWVFVLLLGALFVVGNNDTPLEVIGILAVGLCPIPASLLALRHRRLASLTFAIAAGLWILGVIDGDVYLAKKFGNQIIRQDVFCYLLKTTSVSFFFALFYALTDLLGWPLLWPQSTEPVTKDSG